MTGGAGFIGRALSQALGDDGVQVVGLGRTPPADPYGAVWVTGDIRDSAIRDAFRRVDVVFHLASRVHQDDSGDGAERAHWEVNVEGTRHVLNAALFHGAATIVFFSSVKAMGEGGPTQLDEHSAAAPATPYGRSKLAAEKLVFEAAASGAIRAVTLRLPMVWGPGGGGNMTRMIKAIAARRFPPLPEFGNRRSLVHVSDVVRAARLAATVSPANARTYLVTDGASYSTHEMCAAIRRALGQSTPSWQVPLWSLKTAALIGDGIGRFAGTPVFDSSALARLSGSAWYDSTAITRELGYTPAVTLERGLPEMIQWLQL